MLRGVLKVASRLVTTLVLIVAVASSAVAADEFMPGDDGWQTYVNERFGMRFDYPSDIFVAEAPPQNGDGRTFKGEKATLEIYAFHNVDDDTPASLKRRMAETEGYEDVTYSPSGDAWFVVSGFRGDTIFYEKYAFDDGVIFAFGIDFPRNEKPYYAPIVERIEDSFKSGHLD